MRPPRLLLWVQRDVTISDYKARSFPAADTRIINTSTRLGKTEQGSVRVNKGKVSWFKTLCLGVPSEKDGAELKFRGGGGPCQAGFRYSEMRGAL